MQWASRLALLKGWSFGKHPHVHRNNDCGISRYAILIGLLEERHRDELGWLSKRVEDDLH